VVILENMAGWQGLAGSFFKGLNLAEEPFTLTGFTSGLFLCQSNLQWAVMASNPCEFCGTHSFMVHKAREMMFGFRDEMEYVECASCGSLKIAAIPQDLQRYYPADKYYSYKFKVSLRVHISRLALRAALRLPDSIQAAVPHGSLAQIRWLSLKRGMKILDVGSGSGAFIRHLRAAGFDDAVGIDPYLEEDILDNSGVAVRKAELGAMCGEWDRIMFHHSLEHTPNQLETLSLARARLSPRGICIIRIPIVNWAWKEYGTDWVQLDPPRHLCVHTEKSFRLAAAKSGLRVTRVQYDSTRFQFVGSELYRKGVPLRTGLAELDRHFTKAQLEAFERRAEELNRDGLGDQAVFFLEPDVVVRARTSAS